MAANYFEAFGNQFKGYISTFSTDTSAALIDNLGSVVAVGLVMFIIVRSFMMMRENNYGAIYDIIVQMLKIGFIAFLALNTGHFTSYVVKAFEYFQSGLIEAVSHGLHSTVQITSAWGALDQLWETFTNAFDAVSGLIGKFTGNPSHVHCHGRSWNAECVLYLFGSGNTADQRSLSHYFLRFRPLVFMHLDVSENAVLV